MKTEIQKIILTSMTKIVSHFESNKDSYPYIDTKFDIVSNRDFCTDDEPFHRKECIYSWIQGRGIESLAKHILFFRKSGNNELAEREHSDCVDDPDFSLVLQFVNIVG